MTTEHQRAANRQNAQHATGPRTPRGKATASRNSTRHGVYASTPVIPGLESADAWEQHRAVTIDGLSPGTPFEETLVERVALILWRLGRVARYERSITSRFQAQAPGDLAAEADLDEEQVEATRQEYATARGRFESITRFRQLKPDAPMSGYEADVVIWEVAQQAEGFDLPAFAMPGMFGRDDAIRQIPGWTAARVQQCIDAIADSSGRSAEALVEAGTAAAYASRNKARVGYRQLTRRVRDLRQARMLPESTNLDRVMRYETHLS